ncbi:hypothetical protein JXB28_01515 [Candidatus Woesearchaeota archaeon]|nr:hypothetical protein [Candidatus Woesearchaeota archaeon]
MKNIPDISTSKRENKARKSKIIDCQKTLLENFRKLLKKESFWTDQ